MQTLTDKQIDGLTGESIARNFFKRQGFEVQQLDWIVKRNNQYMVVEVKYKELFTPPPFWGTGLDKTQIYLRNKLLKDLNLKTYILVFVKGSTDIYGQYLDQLEAGKYHDTKNGVRIYPLTSFTKIR